MLISRTIPRSGLASATVTQWLAQLVYEAAVCPISHPSEREATCVNRAGGFFVIAKQAEI